MWGVVAIVAGTARELGMAQADMKQLIEDHGGIVSEEVDDETTVVVKNLQ